MTSKDLIAYLHDGAEACFKEQINGWGNLMGEAADHITALEAELAAANARADARAAALDGFVNYQAEGHFDEVLEHDEQLKSEARAALAAHHADRPGA